MFFYIGNTLSRTRPAGDFEKCCSAYAALYELSCAEYPQSLRQFTSTGHQQNGRIKKRIIRERRKPEIRNRTRRTGGTICRCILLVQPLRSRRHSSNCSAYRTAWSRISGARCGRSREMHELWIKGYCDAPFIESTSTGS